MRDLKFRYWVGDPRKPHFGYFDLMELDHNHTINMRTFDVEQFTGLKDKNGREIYDGDIGQRMVNMDNFNPGGGMGQPIHDQPATKWWQEKRIAEIKIADDGSPLFWNQSIGFRDASEIEIIGNIHQNKELLK